MMRPKGEIMKPKYNWGVMLWVVLMHLGVLAAPFYFNWPAFFLFVTFTWLTGSVGICLCYHRLLTHQAFRVPKPLEYLLTFIGVFASEGGPINWVARHRMHHAFSDTERDPHSPRKGFWWAHMFWLFKHNPLIDNYEFYSAYARDLAADPFQRFLNKTHWIYQILLGIGLYFWGGLPFLVWGLFCRTVFVYHGTWFVNSATHMWGYQTYQANDDSRNLWWVALVAFGEGWHNNHHAHQRSARHGLKFWELDITYIAIKVLGWLKLAHNIHVPKFPKMPKPNLPKITVKLPVPAKLPVPTLEPVS